MDGLVAIDQRIIIVEAIPDCSFSQSKLIKIDEFTNEKIKTG